MRVGVTGHIALTVGSLPIIQAALLQVLRQLPTVHGVTCLAPGSDQLFVRAVRAAGGTYEVVLPSRNYFAGTPRSRWRPTRRLLKRATDVTIATTRATGSAAHAAASRELLNRCDRLIAVWDGRPADVGSTAHTVEQAQRLGMDVIVVWPAGAARVSAV
jgi:hypothetical protein